MRLEINKDDLTGYFKDVNFVEHEFSTLKRFMESSFAPDEDHKILLDQAFLSFPDILIYLVKDRRYIVIGDEVYMSSRNVDVLPVLLSTIDNYTYCNLM